MAAKPDFDRSDWLEWVYPRQSGDLTVFAPSRESAARQIRAQGFMCDASKLYALDRTMTDAQHKKGIA